MAASRYNFIVKQVASGCLITAAIAFLVWSVRDHRILSQLQSDETRALSPVWTIPLAEIQKRQLVSFEFSWPSDPQWQRIAERWKSPPFYIACFRTPSDPRAEYVGKPFEPLECRVLRNGVEVPKVERDSFMAYPEFVPGVACITQFSGLEFRAEPGNHVRIEVSRPKDESLSPGILAVGPYLEAGLVKDMMVGRAIVGDIAFGKAALGILLLVTALVLAYFGWRKGKQKTNLTTSS